MQNDEYELSSIKSPEEAAFHYTLSLIRGKYKILIIYWLHKNNNVMRFNELKRSIGSISFKTLSNTLKELVADDLVIRKEYPQIPPKVEYYLSKRGQSLIPILDAICEWGCQNRIVPNIAINNKKTVKNLSK